MEYQIDAIGDEMISQQARKPDGSKPERDGTAPLLDPAIAAAYSPTLASSYQFLILFSYKSGWILMSSRSM
jgi:hypothetical protein